MEISYRNGAPELLWKSGVQRLYILFGEEDRLKEEAQKALISKLVSPDFSDFDLEIQDAINTNVDGILSAINQIPFGSERRLVIVRGMEQWRDRNKQSELERLAIGVEKLADTCCLVLVVAAEEEEGKRKTALSVKFDNAAKKVGAVVQFEALKGESLIRWIREWVGNEKKQIEDEAIQHLINAVGHDLLPIEQELLKLVAYTGERDRITARDVGTVTASSPEDVMFLTVEAIVKRQTDRALNLLGELHRYDPRPQAVAGRLMALLSRQYRMIWQAKFLAEKGVSPRDVRNLPAEIAAELPAESSIVQLAFKASDLFSQARDYSWKELQRSMDLLLLCDLANKGGVTEETVLFGSDPVGNMQLLSIELTQR